ALMANIAAAAEAADAAAGEGGKPIVLASIDGPAAGIPGDWLDWNALTEGASADFPRPAPGTMPGGRDTMLLYFTSGTTSLPKMVPLDYHYPIAHVITAKLWHRVRDGGLHYTVADTGWAKCAWGKLYGQWMCGAAVFAYDYDKFNPAEMMRVVAENRVTSFCAPPTIYRMMIREDLSVFDFSSLEECTIAGEPLNPEIYNQWLRQTGHKLREGYGQTEMVLAIATLPWMEPRPGSMGKPVPLYDVRILDATDQPCEPGSVGEICLRATHGHRPPGLFGGYHDDPELTADAWYDGWYRTGDLAYADEDGYYWFVGRADDLIKSSGYKIGPFEVESALMQHPAVLECAITGVPDEVRGQLVKATVVCVASRRPQCDQTRAALAKELQDHVKSVTEPYKYPRVVEFADELPKTISGKIQRRIIRAGRP
ncbi:MAG: AMP-binding protein, partial [Planctomycetes bacterium]|nr:AMP-binding protein [Planctomycetota bacterium]